MIQTAWTAIINVMLLSFFVFFTVTYGIIAGYDFISDWGGKSAMMASGSKSLTVDRIAPGTAIQLKIHYKLCNHTETSLMERNEDWVGKQVNELSLRFPKEQGWKMERFNGSIVFSRDEMGLCPEDANKRHMGAAGEYIGIFIGPPGINGGLDKLTRIRVEQLPEHLKVLANSGRLEINREEELAQVLDGYDE